MTSNTLIKQFQVPLQIGHVEKLKEYFHVGKAHEALQLTVQKMLEIIEKEVKS